MYVDACAMRLALEPTHFDVIVTENLFGDILSDQAAAVAGSIGMLPSASIGGRVGLYEPVHGSAPDIAGKNRANPFGAIASVALLLRHTANLSHEASFVDSCDSHRARQRSTTCRSCAGTDGRPRRRELGDAVVHALDELIDHQHAYHAV